MNLTRHGRGAQPHPVVRVPLGTVFGQRRGRHPFELPPQGLLLVRTNQALSTRDRTRLQIAGFAFLLLIAIDAATTDPEDLGNHRLGHPVRDGIENMAAEVE